MNRHRQYLLAGYIGWMVLLAGIYSAFPGLRITGEVISVSGAAGIVAGVLVNRPAHPLGWCCLAAVILAFAAGNAIYFSLISGNNGTLPFPTVADGVYLASYPLYAAGFLFFIRWRTAGQDRRSLLDALTVTAALALLAWIYLIEPYVRNAGLSSLSKTIAIAYPLGDILVLVMLARLLAPPGSLRIRSIQLLALGSAGMLASDVLYGWQRLNGTYRFDTPAELGWGVFVVAWGAAALHPSMVAVTQPAVSHEGQRARFRLLVLMLASLAAPAMLIVQSLTGARREVPVIAVFSAVLYLLVFLRLADMIDSNQRALTRERSLTVAATRLAGAARAEDVAQAARSAVLTLTGPPDTHEVLLAVRGGGTALRVIPPGRRDAEPVRPPQELPPGWLSVLDRGGPRLLPAGRLDGLAAGGLGSKHAALLCPLALDERASGQPLIGALIVSGGERELAVLSGTLMTLASQAALALERVTLNEEVSRRNQLRTVAREAGTRIREHLAAAHVLQAAEAALSQDLGADVVQLCLAGDKNLAPGAAGEGAPGLPAGDLHRLVSLDVPDRLLQHFRAWGSYAVPDLEQAEREEPAVLLPADLLGTLRRQGVSSLLVTPFGAPAGLLGIIIAGRRRPAPAWTPAEIDAVESIAADLGRGLNHAQQYEQENRLVQELKALDRAKSDFFATVSHELRSPLTSIQGYLEILAENGTAAAERHTMLTAIQRSCDRLQSLIDDVFMLAKLESGTLRTVKQPVQVTDAIAVAVESVRPSAAAAKLTLTSPEPRRDLTVDADHGQLERAVINLLTNAVKYTPEHGRVDVTAAPDGDWALIQIHDTGIGIPEHDQPQLFTRFYRASNATAAGIPGTGLGLAIVRTIVTNHGGHVALTSQPGAGTTVTIRLPLLAAAPS